MVPVGHIIAGILLLLLLIRVVDTNKGHMQ
jgi:hypothetical protein